MTKEKKVTPEKQEIELSDGTKVTVTEPTTPQVRRSRDFAGTHPADVYLYVISECCEFDGEKLAPDELDNLRARDYLYVEGCVRELLGEKN